ncbi:MAG: hypothetical protein ACFFC7_13830 [Candidatus Hermodarchaeota archaeon]
MSEKRVFNEVAAFGPFFKDIVGLPNVEDGWILAFMFYQGGYIESKSLIFQTLDFNFQTFNPRLDALIKQGLIKQHEEFNSFRLTLVLTPNDLNDQLENEKNKVETTRDFLLEMDQKVQIKQVIRRDAEISRAFKSSILQFLPNSEHAELLAELLMICYIDQEQQGQMISFSKLLELFENPEYASLKNKYLKNSYKQRQFLQIISDSYLLKSFSRRILSRKNKFSSSSSSQWKEFYVCPRFSLSRMIQYLFQRSQIEFEEYETLVTKIYDWMSEQQGPQDQELPYPRDVKHKLDTCLSCYKELWIFDNSIYYSSGRRERDNLLDLIEQSDAFTPKHKIRLLSHKPPEIPSSIQNQVEAHLLPENINQQHKERDIILFKHLGDQTAYGCLIFPSDLAPYYTITSHIVNSVLTAFDTIFKESQEEK